MPYVPADKTIGELDEFPPMNFRESDSFPIEMDSTAFPSISLPPLKWLHQNTMPTKTTIRNTGFLINVEPEYSEQAPMLIGSVLLFPYKFWCFHFHWGPDNESGCEHRVDGNRFPMEIHLLFYNVRYANTTEALKAKDGVMVLVYMCKLTADRKNMVVDDLTSNLEKIKRPNESALVDSFPMSSWFDDDLTDYVLYWRAYGEQDQHESPWIISLKPVWINESHLSRMRSLRGSQSPYITNNSQCLSKYRRSEHVFMVTADYTRTAEECAAVPVSAAATGIVSVPQDAVENDGTVPPPRRPASCVRDSGDLEGCDELETARITAMRSMDIIMSLNDVDESTDHEVHESTNLPPKKGEKVHREGTRMNKTATLRENHIKNRLQKNAELKNYSVKNRIADISTYRGEAVNDYENLDCE